MECCILRSVVNNSHANILLKDGETLLLGRGPLTQIKDKKCSRNQVEVKLDLNSKQVELRQIGPNPSSIDGKLLFQNHTVTVHNGQTLCILRNEYPYVVEFVNMGHVVSPPKHKRSSEDLEIDQRKTKLLKGCSNNESSIFSAINDPDEDERLKLVDDELVQLRENSVKHRSSLERNSFKTLYSISNHSTPALQSEWQEPNKNLLVFVSKDLTSSNSICGFDLDGTIIRTKSGKVFPKDFDDWKILCPEVKSKLKKLHDNHSKIVFFTNQKSLGQLQGSIVGFKRKIENIVKELNLPIQVFVSMGNGIYRKPALGMWEHLLERANDDIPVNLNDSFYVGDAAGREAKWALGKKKDFSVSDRLFAINAGLKFYTPEEFFLGWKTAGFKLPSFDPRSVSSRSLFDSQNENSLIAPNQELVVLVGFPASGKTFFAQSHLIKHGYVHINRDSLKSWTKCIAECKSALSKGNSAVVDNTNPDIDSRKRFVAVAQEFGIPCRCFWFNITLEHAKHNNRFRQLTLHDVVHAHVNDIVLNSYKCE
uniref:PNK FHA domain-containing protein n=1 Tax=Strigamia maritima TaxID=126957 RepID=T1J499_STRMM